VNVRFDASGPLRGALRVPPDKSISHRAALLGAMASEPVRIRNYLNAADTNSTLEAVRELGALVERRPDEVVIRGCGMRNAASPVKIDVGNAGTLMRLLPGWLAFQPGGRFELDGDASIRGRPVDRIAVPLERMGARIEATNGRYPPFTVHGGSLHGIEYELPVASAQVKSCVLLAGLATAETSVVEAVPARDHTERMLLRAGAPVTRAATTPSRGYRTTVGNADELELEEIVVPGDLSSAAFLIAAGILVKDSRLVLEDVGVNWTRTGFLRILERMDAIVLGDLEPPDTFEPREPIAELDVRNAPIVATEVAAHEVPLAIDELPLVALLGCFAEGETVVRGAAELRVKESDRIATVVEGLRGLGAEIEALPDGFAVRGTGRLRGGRIDAHRDHRLALLGAVAGLASDDGVEVVGMEAAAVSYPTFTADLATLAR
jgi:3-phosphoshikimate 1-carboxyvinyltransferase